MQRRTQKLRQLIRETARMCLRSVYNRPDTKLDDLLGKLDQSEQLDLTVVQDRCVTAAEHYLRGQLGARSSELDPYIAAITDARVARSERRVLGDDEDHVEAERAEREALWRFRNAIEQDDRIHASLLSAVRRKVEQYQYRPSSVPFELLQNADDALGERHRLDPTARLSTRSSSSHAPTTASRSCIGVARSTGASAPSTTIAISRRCSP
jgi:hypothetical protein